MRDRILTNEPSIKELKSHCDILKNINIRNCVRFIGFPISAKGDVVQIILDFLDRRVNIPCERRDFDSVYGLENVIKVNFFSNLLSRQVLSARKSVMNFKVVVVEELTKFGKEPKKNMAP
ncbi:hypothetical protein JTB14_017937 [Gonioctena quinquepunctata]|nr:hypothetical protein JTB14_017937 [Gonioctena quinquepunctata]